MPNVPLVTGSVASPTAGQPSALGEIFSGLAESGDIMRKRQLERLLQERQAYDATAPMRDDIGQRVQQDPSLAQDPDIIRQVQALYQGTGVKAPVAPATPALRSPEMYDPALGVNLPGLNRPASGGVDSNALTGNTASSFIQKNIPLILSTQPENRASLLEGVGVRLTDRDKQTLLSLPYQLPAALQEKTDADLEKSFSTQIKTFLAAGDMPKYEAAVKSAMARATAAGWTPQRIQDTFSGYIEEGVSEMSPIQVATLHEKQAKTAELKSLTGKDDEQTAMFKALLQPRVDEVRATTALRRQEAQHFRDLSANMANMFGPRVALTQAQTKQALNNAAKLVEQGDLIHQEAEWYGARATEIQSTKGTDPRRWTAAVGAISRAMDNSQSIIAQIEGDRAKYESSLNAADPTAVAKAQPILAAWQEQITEQRNRYNTYAQQQAQLLNNGGFPADPYYESGAGVSSPPALPPAPQQAPQVLPSAVPAPTKINPHTGKLSYYWPSEHKYYTSPPPKN